MWPLPASLYSSVVSKRWMCAGLSSVPPTTDGVFIIMAYVVMAYVVMTYALMAYIVMAYVLMA